MVDKREYAEARKAVPTVKVTNEHQKAMFTNAYFAACDIIGGIENTTYDYPENSQEYQDAVEYLKNHNQIVSDIYDAAITREFGAGYNGPAGAMVKHFRFAGKEFTMSAIEEIVKSMGY